MARRTQASSPTPGDPVGIQVGTAITTLVRKTDHKPATEVGFRHLWGQTKLSDLTATAEAGPDELYDSVEPNLTLGLPFAPVAVVDGWPDWPALPDLFPVWFSGVVTSRDEFLVDVDLDRLQERVITYFNQGLSHDEIARRYPRVMTDTRRFDARSVRDRLLRRGGPNMTGFVRHAYRPFDNRWLYYEEETKLLHEKSPYYPPHVFEGNLWLVAQRRSSQEWSPGPVTSHIAGKKLLDFAACGFPLWLRDDGLDGGGAQRRPNLSEAARNYLDRLGLGVEELFHHVIAVLHDPTYLKTNAGALRMEWPRIPLEGWPDGDTLGAVEELAASAARGRELAALLDSETPIPGVTTGPLRPEMAAIAVPSTTDGGNMAGDDFSVTAGWGHFGQGEAVMPGQGRVVERSIHLGGAAALGSSASALGDTAYDVYLNDRAYWRNVPAAVWGYKLGGYQVLKKWLSYRERGVLDRPLKPEEVQHFTNTARRITAILLATNR